MSTTYYMVINGKDVEIARTHFNCEQVELTWVNPLADLLVDEEILMSDSGNQLYETVGDLRALEVPKMWDDMTTYELIEEIKRVRDERDEIIGKQREEAVELNDKLSSAISEIKDAEEVSRIQSEELVAAKEDAFQNRCSADHFSDEIVGLEKELVELEGDVEEEITNGDLLKKDIEELKDEVHGLVVDKDEVANANMHYEDELHERVKALSNALQESLDREAEFRKEIRGMKQRESDDTTFEDYVEIRRVVQGEGDLWSITHGEFLEVLYDIIHLSKSTVGFKSRDEELEILSNLEADLRSNTEECNANDRTLRGIINHREEEIEIVKRREKHFLECLKEEQTLNRDLNRTNRELERKLLTINDVVIDTENFTVTIFGEERSDGRGGFFEHDRLGEDFGGGLWFEFDDAAYGNNKYLQNFAGSVYSLPDEVAEALREEGIKVDSSMV